MISKCKVPLTFDSVQLKRDLTLIKPADWVPHFNTGYYEGEWSGVALRSVGGVSTQLYPDPNANGTVEDTEVLSRCKNISEVLTKFECPVRSARLLKLAAGAVIKEHRDYQLGFAEGEIRLHIPITTNPDVEFFLAGEKVVMNEGECWYLDFGLPHRVQNNGSTDRVHLVVDCVVNTWLEQMLSVAAGELSTGEPEQDEPAASAPTQFERFRQFVLQDASVQQRLVQTDDRQSFSKLTVRIGREFGFRFSKEDVELALHAARRDWLERWIE